MSADKAGYDKPQPDSEDVITIVKEIREQLGATPLRVVRGALGAGWSYRVPVNSNQNLFFEVKVHNSEIVLELRQENRLLRAWRTRYELVDPPEVW